MVSPIKISCQIRLKLSLGYAKNSPRLTVSAVTDQLVVYPNKNFVIRHVHIIIRQFCWNLRECSKLNDHQRLQLKFTLMTFTSSYLQCQDAAREEQPYLTFNTPNWIFDYHYVSLTVYPCITTASQSLQGVNQIYISHFWDSASLHVSPLQCIIYYSYLFRTKLCLLVFRVQCML